MAGVHGPLPRDGLAEAVAGAPLALAARPGDAAVRAAVRGVDVQARISPSNGFMQRSAVGTRPRAGAAYCGICTTLLTAQGEPSQTITWM